MNKLEKKLKDLPESPGIYIFFDRTGDVLYVGKALSLKKRVRSYFTKSFHSPRIARLREKIADFKYSVTKSEVDALILECNLIKRYRPKYNIDYKDDKSYPFIKITKEPFPSISLVRIPSLATGHQTLITNNFLFGPYPKVRIVKEAMRKIRSIFPLRSCHRVIRENKTTPFCLDYHIGLCSGPCQHKIEKDDYRRLVRGVILLLKGKKRGLVNELRHRMNKLSNELKFEEATRIRNQLLGLEEIIGLGVPAGVPTRSVGRGLSPLKELRSALNLPSLPVYIEGFDVSNIGGEFATGALVVFQNGIPYKNGYRHFGIKTVEGINDVQMLAEVARRHYRNLMEEKERFPDLILVDGGVGQLNAVSAILNEFKLKIPIVSLAKRLEEVFKKEDGRVREIHLSLSSPALHLLQHIRDEAHRFALKYHKILRDREMKKSILDEISGIGEKRKQKLLKHFGSIEKIRKSSMEELRKIGIPSNLAKQILGEHNG